MAVRGDDPLKIKQRAGHSTFSTTEIYIREAESIRQGFGEPFPALPSCLLDRSAGLGLVLDSGPVPIAITGKTRRSTSGTRVSNA
jgi:hypothetical protein